MTAGRDYDGLLAEMLARAPEVLPEWTGRDDPADFGRALLELFAHMGDVLGYYQDRVAAEALLGTATTRRSVIQHLRLIGYELRTAAPAATTLQVGVPETVTSTVLVRPGDAFTTRVRPGVPSVRFEYTGAAALPIAFGGITPAGGRRVFDGVPVEEGRLVTGEVLGTAGDGSGQRFALALSRPILRPGNDRDLVVTTAQPGDWRRVPSLVFSGPADLHFTVEVDADDRAVLCFGDGVTGAVPRGTVTATYRAGGGTAGNVGAHEVVLIGSSDLAALGATVTNARPARQGADREDIAHAVEHAPSVFRSFGRAVTAADYEALALSYPGVAKARATTGSWNEVVLHVVPEGGGDVSDVLESGLVAFFDDLRMAGQIVSVVGVAYRPVVVTAEIGVDTRFVLDDVVEAVRSAAAGLLSLTAVDFGGPVYLSRFYEVIQGTPGVLHANVTDFHRDDAPDPRVEPRGRLDFAPFELPCAPEGPGVRLNATRGRH